MTTTREPSSAEIDGFTDGDPLVRAEHVSKVYVTGVAGVLAHDASPGSSAGLLRAIGLRWRQLSSMTTIEAVATE